MLFPRRALPLLLLAVLLGALPACGGEGRAVPEVGHAAPGYAAVSLTGDSVSLAGLRGRVVLLNVWATWCGPCREEIPALQKLYQAHASLGLELVGVSVDAKTDAGAVRDFVREYGMTYPVWLDPEERVTNTFRTVGVPSTFLIGRDGKILWKHVGPVRLDDPELVHVLGMALHVPAPKGDARV